MLNLVLGGARSGKSAYAEQLALNSGLEVVYLATATIGADAAMLARVAEHRQRRPSHWLTHEESLALPSALAALDEIENRVILIDCLTLWITNVLLTESDPTACQGYYTGLLAQLSQQRNRVILVSNETGMGVVPMGELSRRFVDDSGRLHQQLAQMAETVTLLVAGLPLSLKPSHPTGSL